MSSSKTSSVSSGLQAYFENSEDLQDATRVENLQEMVSVAREFDGSTPDGTLAVSSSGSRSSRNGPRFPTARIPAAW